MFLALAYARQPLKDALRDVWRLDVILAEALQKASEAVLVQVRLAWWRDQIANASQWPLARDPALLALHAHHALIVDAEHLSELADAWSILAGGEDEEGAEVWNSHAVLRGSALFGAFSTEPVVRLAGEVWGLNDVIARAPISDDVRSVLIATAHQKSRSLDWGAWPAGLTPLKILARFAEADLGDLVEGRQRHSRLSRVFLALRHGLFA